MPVGAHIRARILACASTPNRVRPPRIELANVIACFAAVALGAPNRQLDALRHRSRGRATAAAPTRRSGLIHLLHRNRPAFEFPAPWLNIRSSTGFTDDDSRSRSRRRSEARRHFTGRPIRADPCTAAALTQFAAALFLHGRAYGQRAVWFAAMRASRSRWVATLSSVPRVSINCSRGSAAAAISRSASADESTAEVTLC